MKAAVRARLFSAATRTAKREVRRVEHLNEPEDILRMRSALALAAEAARDGDVPIGAALIVGNQTFLARNEKERRPDPTAHAEILALRSAAAALGRWRLVDATLFVTKEPCVMCAGAIVAARIARLVFGCRDPKGGAAGSVIDVFGSVAANHHVNVIAGVLEAEAAQQLADFFAARRAVRRERLTGEGAGRRNVL